MSEGGSETLYIVLTEAASEDVTVTLTVSGTATDGADYELLPSAPYVLTPGTTELAVGISTVIDGIYEGDETLEFVISTLSGPAVTGSVDRVTVTIIDADEAPVVELPEIVTVTLRLSSVTVSEGGSETLYIVLTEATSEDVTVTLTVSGTATDGADYELLPSVPYVLTPGTTELAVGISTVLDGIYEGDETLEFVISTLSGPAVTGSVDRVTVTIIDADEAPVVELPEDVTVTLRLSSVTVSEGSSETLYIVLTEATSEDVTVTLTVSGTATDGADYELLPSVPYVLTPGTTELAVGISTVLDGIYEGDETLEFVISTLSGPAVTGSVDRVTVTIIDADEAPVVELPEVVTVTLRLSSVTVSEGSSETLYIVLTEAASEDVTVTLTVSGTATDGADYELLPSVPYVLTPGTTELAVGISTVLDGIYEGDETLEFVISTLSGPAVTGSVDRVTVTIIDADEAPVVELPEDVTVTLRLSSVTVSEGGSETLYIVLTEAASEDVTVTLTVSGTATDGADYELLPSVPYVLTPGTTELAVGISTVIDGIYEGDETLEFVISTLSGPAVTGSVDRVTVTIIDADEAPVVELPEDVTVTLRLSSVTVSEGGSETLYIVLTEAASEDVTVTLTVAGTATDGADYELLPSVPYVLTPGMTELAVGISTVIDGIYEGDETLEFVISTLSGSAVTGSVDRVTVTIIDADEAPVVELPEDVTVTLRVSSETVAEGSSETLYIVLTEAASEDVTVTLTVSGTATDGADYELLPSAPYVLTPGTTELAVGISTVLDGIYEGDETLEFVISTLSGPAVTGSVDRVTVTIIDADEAPTPIVEVGFESTTYRVGEDIGRVEFTVSVLSGVLTETITLSYATVEGSATADSDYTSRMDTLTLSEMTMSVTFSVTIKNDGLLESEEAFTVELSGGPSSITLDPAIAIVTILDNDVPPVADEIGFAVTSASVEEGETYEIELQLVDRSGNLLSYSSDISVMLEVVHTPATTLESEEYEFARTVTIPAGATRKTFEFRSLEDTDVEVDESILIRISEVDQVGFRSGYDMLTLLVIDDDAEIGFGATTHSVPESAGGVTIALDIVGRLAEGVTLGVEYVPGTASETEDYAPLTREVQLLAGAARATLFVQIVNDELYENADTFSVRLVEPEGGLPLGVELATGMTEATVTITNDDEIEIGFVEGMYTFLENQRRGTAQVRYSGSEIAPGVEVLVYYSTTVEIGDSIDINDVSGTLVLSSNNRVYNINFPITDDNAFNRATERYTISLGTFDMNSGLTFRSDRDSASLNVLTDDVLDFGFSVTEYEVNEGSGTVELEVSVLRNTIGAGERVVVRYSTTPGSATSSDPSDFESVTGEVILSSTATVVTFAIPIVNDDILEDSESFVVTLRKADGRDTLRLLQSESTVTILDDNDPVTIGFGSSLYSVREDQSAVLDVGVLSGGLERDITVFYDIRGGSAVAGVDYEYMTGTVTLSSAASETISISLLEDNIFDPGETFTVVLTGHAGPSSVMLGLSEAVVRIDEEDSRPTVSLDQIADVGEGETVTVIARLSGRIDELVQLTLGPESADYKITEPTLEISAGDLTATFELMIIDDNLFEGVEEKTVELRVSDGVVDLGEVEQTFTILDAQSSRPVLSLDPVAPIEEGEERIVTARLHRALNSTLTITVSTRDAVSSSLDADDKDDYRLLTSTIRIPAGAKLATFAIETLEDTDYEGDEEFRLVLSPVGDLVDLGTLTRTVTIVDNDIVTVGFEDIEYTVEEGGVSVTVVVVTDRLSVRDDITLIYETLDGSALVSDNDYRASKDEIVLRAGTTSTTIEIFIPEDDAFEYDEEFTVILGAPVGGLASFVTIDPSRAVTRVTIENDDELTVGFEATAYRVSEGDVQIELPVVVMGEGTIGAGTEIEVPYSVVADTAEAGTDYEVVSGVLILGLPTTSAIEILISADEVFEYDEEFMVVLDVPVGIMSGATIATVTIADDDTVEIGFERATYNVLEDSGTATVTIGIISGQLAAGVTVSVAYESSDDSATRNDDYTPVMDSVILSSQMSSVSISVTIEDDDLFEGDEAFLITLTKQPGDSRVGLDILPQTTVTIEDDDIVKVGFESAVYSVSEDSGTVELTVRVIDGALGDEITLRYATDAGTAGADEDYVSRSDSLILSSRVTELTFTVPISADALFEIDEKFSVVLSGAPSGVILTVDTAEVTIEDDDTATIGFVLTSYLILENGGQQEVVVEIKDGTLAEGVTVAVIVSTEDGTARAGASEDYISTVETVVLSSTNVQRPVVIPINLDRLIEGTEVFSVVLNLPEGSSLSDRVILDPVSTAVSITDELIVTIGFDERTYEVSEAAEGVSVAVSILSEGVMPGDGITLSVDYEITDGSANAGTDYRDTSGTLNFAGETRTQEIFIPITDDSLFEGSESFTVTLSVSASSIGPDSPTIQLNPGVAYVTIVDDDEVIIGFQETTYRIDEDTATVGVTIAVLSGRLAPGVDIGVNYFTSDDSARSGSDYTIATGTLIFNSGLTQQTIKIALIDDKISERGADGSDEERFTVGLTAVDPTIPNVLLLPSETEVLIVDNEPDARVTVAPIAPVLEGDEIVIEVYLTTALAEDVTVTLVDVGTGNAESTDYTLPVQLIKTIVAGETTTIFLIGTTGNDGLYELTETIDLEFMALNSVIAVTAMIEDDDDAPAVRITSLQPTMVTEGASVEILVELYDARSERDVVVDFALSGTAVEGTDYTVSDRSVTILSGDSSAVITLVATDDTVVYSGDAPRTVVLVLTDASGGVTLGDSLTHSVTIVDNDVRIGFGATTHSVPERAGGVTIALDIVGQLAEGVTLGVEYVRGTASETEDYAPLTREVPLLAGATRATLFVQIVNDELYENADTFSVRLVEPEGGLPLGVELATGMTEATVTITNDDEIEIGFVEVMYTFLENQGRGTAQVRYSGSEIAPGVEVLVHYTTTVVMGDSFNLKDLSGNLVLSSNQRVQRVYDINVGIMDDKEFNFVNDEYEMSLILLDMNDGLSLQPGREKAGLNVLTDDVLDFGFSVTEYEVNEGSGTVELEVSVLKNTISAGAKVVVFYSTTPGSATSSDPSDFKSVTGELILSSTATVVTFAIPIVNDDILEASESFVVTLRKADGRDTLRLSQSESTVTILDDNDPVTVGFGSTSYSVIEGAGAVVDLDVGVLSGGLERDITVFYDIRGGSAVAGTDYEYMTGTVTLSSAASETISISLLDDNIFDPGETFTVVLTGHAGPSSVMLGLSEAVVRIDEDDPRPTVSLDQIADVGEGETVTVIARLSGRIDELVQLTLGPESADYKITTPTVEISAGDLTVAFELVIIDDGEIEGIEEATLALSVSGAVVGLGDAEQTFKILDVQSRPSVLLDPIAPVTEGDERIVTVRLNRALASTLTLTVSTTEAVGLTRATNSIDYKLSTDTIRIPVGALAVTFAIETLEDTDYEGDEEFRLVLNPVGDLVDLGTLTRTVTIVDNDIIVTVGFEKVEYAVVESGLSVTVVVVADRQAVRNDITLNYETVDDSARASGGDYTTSRGAIMLTAGTTRATIEILITDDSAFEYDEEFTVILGAPDGGLASFVTIDPSRAVTRVTIENDDAVTVGFEDSTYSVSESAGGLTLTVAVLTGSLGDDTEIEVPYSVVAGSAEAGSDYVDVVGGVVTFGSSLTSAIEILITDDNSFENDETFTVVLGVLGGVMLDPMTATVTILNDDELRPTITLVAFGQDSEKEGVSLLVIVGLDEPLGVSLTVELAVDPSSTAVEGEDFTLSGFMDGVGSYTIGAGMTESVISLLTTVDDQNPEPTETVVLVLSVPGDEVDLGEVERRLEIQASDFPEATLRPADLTITEGDPSQELYIDLARDTFAPIEFRLRSSGDAGASDYVLSSLVLPTGASSLTVTVSVLDDAVYDDGTERVDFELEIISGPAELGTEVRASLTIEDNESRPTVSLDEIDDIGEGEVATVTVRLSGALDQRVTVDIEVMTTTVETLSSDYDVLVRRVDIPAGALTATFAIKALDDSDIEDPETLVLELRVIGPVDVVDGKQTLTILDTDSPQPSLSLDSIGVLREGDSRVVTARLNRVLPDMLTIMVTTLAADPTRAADNLDYGLSSELITIPANALEVTFAINAIDDDVYEGDEEFLLILSPVGDVVELGTLMRTVIIREDDAVPNVSIDTVGPVSESGTVTLTVRLSGLLKFTSTVDVSVVGGTASSLDYELSSRRIVIPGGELTETLELRVLPDDIYEETETLELRLSGTDGIVNLGVSEQKVELKDDNDVPQVSLDPIGPVTEAQGVSLTVRLAGKAGFVVTVELDVDDSSTAETPADYVLSPLSVEIPAGSLTATVLLQARRDTIIEKTETVVLNISALRDGRPLSESQSEVEIIDARRPRVSLVLGQTEVIEGVTLLVSAELEDVLNIPVTVELEIDSSSTAVEGIDFELSRLPGTIDAGQREVVIATLEIPDDQVDEFTKILTLLLKVPGGEVDLGVGVFTLTILDNDPADVVTATLQVSSETIAEGGSETLYIELSEATTEDVTVTLTVLSGSTATESADYSLLPLAPYVLTPGMTELAVGISTVVDGLYEGDETVSFELSVVSGPAVASTVSSVVTVTIVEEVPTVSLALSSASVVEGVGVTVSAELSVVYASEVEVLLEIVGGSAEFADYLTPSTLRATLPAGSTSVAYVLTATVDGLYEGLAAETLELRVRVFGTGGLISSSVETLEIEDVDKVTIGFQETTYRKAEGENAVLRVAVLVGTLAPGVELSLNYETLDDSAYASSDYTATVGTLLLNSVSTGQDIIVPLIDDEISEVEERLTVELTAVITSDPRVTVAPSVSEILIGDNDPVAGFRIVPIMAVTESETLTVEVVLDSVSASTVTVTLEDALSGTANSGADYSLPGMLTATIAVGDLTATFRISTLSDELYEGSETLDLRASTDVVPGIVEGRATILDEDVAPRVRFERTTSTVAEGSSISILVVLEGALIETDVEVEFTVSGTAVEVTDYVLLSRSVTILSGDATSTIELETLDDSVYGGGVSETVVLVLTGASGGVRLGERVTHTVTIIDDELAPVVEPPEVVVVTVTLRLSSVTVSEGSSETLYIDLSEAASEDVTVTLTVSGTATDGADYELLPSAPYVLTPGMTELAVGISTVIDGIYEGDETLEFVISMLSGPAVTGSVDRVTVTIIDADEAPVVELPEDVTV